MEWAPTGALLTNTMNEEYCQECGMPIRMCEEPCIKADERTYEDYDCGDGD